MAPPKVTRPLSAVSHDWKTGRYPWQLMVAVASWVVLAITLLVSRIGAPESTDANNPASSSLRDTLGPETVVATNAQDHWFLPLLPWLGVVVLVVAGALLLGQGWARLVLAAFGVLAVVALAMGAQWHVFLAAIALVMGSVFGLLLPSHRYLTGTRQSTDDSAAGRMMS